jgi:putative aldouronate transport system substrate-binding protein
MTADEASEYATIMNDIETYRSEMVINFILGLEPLDNYDTFVDTIRSMNIDRAIEIYQAALNRYNARG